MKNLCDLIGSFSDEEAELIVKHYLLKRNSYSKRLRLFNMIRLEGIGDDLTAARRLYQKKPNAAFSQLKKRLKDDILDLMLVFNLNDDQLSGYTEAEMVASKQILQGKILIKRGLTSSGMDLLKKAFKLAGKFEAFEVQTMAYEALRNYSDDISVPKDIADLEMQFQKNVDILYDIINLRMDNKRDLLLRENISMKEHTVASRVCQDTSHSARLHFQYIFNQMEEFFSVRQYYKAREAAEEILPLLDHDNQVLTRNQKGKYYHLFAQILMALNFYKESVFYARKACDYFPAECEKQARSFCLVFRGLFYSGEIDIAIEDLQNFLGDNKNENNQLQNEIELFKAWHAFSQGDYVASIKGLNNCFKLSASHSEISLNGKLLELLNLLMMKDTGWFDYKLDSFRKYISNSPEIEGISRFALIYKIFGFIRQLRKNDNDELHAGYCRSLESLNEKGKPYSWNPLSYELIPFNSLISAGYRFV